MDSNSNSQNKNLIFKNESSNIQHGPLVWSMGPALRAGERKLHLGSNPSHAIGEHGNNPGQTVSTALTDLVSIPAGLRGARYGSTVWEYGMGVRKLLVKLTWC